MNNSTIFYLFLMIFSLALLPTATCTSSNQTDLHSLLAFKSSLNDPQGALNSWNQSLHFCSWNGIRCGRRHPDRVVRVNLTSQGLVGPLSPHIGNLSFLRTIILQNNTFHGPIPTEFSSLRRLRIINLSNNSFTGPIPRNLSRYSPHLSSLNLIDNKLSGNIPAELGSMSKLEVLGLSKNYLSGTIPPSIGNITSLTSLSLANCGFIGEIPESLTQLSVLNILKLGSNNLTGTIPSALFNISTINYFGVSYNKLEGVIPTTIGVTLPMLTTLNLYKNHFTGPIPTSIPNATLLEIIDLSFNHFTGPIPRFEKLTHLFFFSCKSNRIADDINFISSFTNFTELVGLQVGDNPLVGSIPETIANLSTRLSFLSIDGTNIHGNIPSGIGKLVGLTTLFLSRNNLEGSIPVSIAEIYNLQELFLDANRFTNEIPTSLGNLTFLIYLNLTQNQLTGNVPSSIGNLTNLLDLHLSLNNFSGSIPQEIVSISSLTIALDLSYNNFEGSIPQEVGSLTNLGVLDLSNNRLSGVIPNSLSHCMSLEQLFLEGNSLEGEIPSGLSALMGLQYLDLSRNNLSGPLPRFLGNLKLEYLNLTSNKLSGEVPTIGVFKNKTAISIDGNNQLCGGILELKLPPCPAVKSRRTNLSTFLKILIPILGAGGIFLVLLALFTYKKRKSRKNVSPVSLFTGTQFMRLSYADLLKATSGFAETNQLGVGRFGSVYKGILDDGQTQVAVKVLNLSVRGASKSFIAECNALRDIRHRNLLKILSVCESIDFQGNDFKALIYEFKANGSLEKWLYHSEDEEEAQNAETNNLSMMQRLNIAIDTAQAIEYLHFGTGSSVVHGDLKPSNILLDHDMTACVGDFGLAKIVSDVAPSHENSSSIGIGGTIGYIPPEYGTSHLVSMQGDVYSFGVVLLEMFTNKRPVDDHFTDRMNLHNFVCAGLPDRAMEIVDPRLRSMNNTDKVKGCVTAILSIGVSCSKEMPRDRMTMKDVVDELHKIRKLLGG